MMEGEMFAEIGALKSDATLELVRPGEIYVRIAPDEIVPFCRSAAERGFELVDLTCVEGFDREGRASLLYCMEKWGIRETLTLVCTLDGGSAPSVDCIFSSASWYERKIRDLFGVDFPDAFDKRRLVLHECYPEGFHPLKKSVPNRPFSPRTAIPPEDEYQFMPVEGEGVYQVPVGPVHAGIIEPGHFRFSVIGETIVNLEVRMFYKHRGIEKLAEGKKPEECVAVAEAISGDESVANALGFSLAIEKIAGITVPDRAEYLRMIYAELERIHSHLGDMAGMLVDVAYPVGATRFTVLREEIFRLNRDLTGSRFMRGAVRIGGVGSDLSHDQIRSLSCFLPDAQERFRDSLKVVLASPTVIDRFATTGVIEPRFIRPLHLTGPTARASGASRDVRRDHPYGAYADVSLPMRMLTSGDVLARFSLKASEVMDSLLMIRACIENLPDGPVITKDSGVPDGYARGIVESARGQNVHHVRVRDGRIDRYSVRTASFCNWQAIQHAVMGNIVADFPVINKSLNLSYAGTDL